MKINMFQILTMFITNIYPTEQTWLNLHLKLYSNIDLIYVNWSLLISVVNANDSDEDEEELGGLFRVSRPQKSKKFTANSMDCSRFTPDTSHNWDLEEVESFQTLF